MGNFSRMRIHIQSALRTLLFIASLSFLTHAGLASQYEHGTSKVIAPLLCLVLSTLFLVAAWRTKLASTIAISSGGLLPVTFGFPPSPDGYGEYFSTMHYLVWFEAALCIALLILGMSAKYLDYRARTSEPVAREVARASRIDLGVFAVALLILGMIPVVIGYLLGEFISLHDSSRKLFRSLTFAYFLTDAPLFFCLHAARSRVGWYLVLGAVAPVLAVAPFVYSLPNTSRAAIDEATAQMVTLASILAPYGSTMGLVANLIGRRLRRTLSRA